MQRAHIASLPFSWCHSQLHKRGKLLIWWEAGGFCCTLYYETVIIGYTYSQPRQPVGMNEVTLIFMYKFAKMHELTDWLQVLDTLYKDLGRLFEGASARSAIN